MKAPPPCNDSPARLVLLLMRHHRRSSDVRADVEAARALIDAHQGGPLRVADLAAAAGVSEGHFIRQFHRHVGVPPYAYLTARRVVRAAQLLRDGVAPSEVAHLTGFADQPHFTRRFRRAFGMPPGEYQRRARRGDGGAAAAAALPAPQ